MSTPGTIMNWSRGKLASFYLEPLIGFPEVLDPEVGSTRYGNKFPLGAPSSIVDLIKTEGAFFDVDAQIRIRHVDNAHQFVAECVCWRIRCN